MDLKDDGTAVPLAQSEFGGLQTTSKREYLNDSTMWKAAECVDQMRRSAEKLSQLYMKKMRLLAAMKIRDTEHFVNGLTYQIILSKHKNVLDINNTQYQTAANEAVKIKELIQKDYFKMSFTEDLHCLNVLVNCCEEEKCCMSGESVNCHAPAMPLSSYCKEHIYLDKSQFLYTQCKFVEGESRKRCMNPTTMHSSTHVNCLPSYITADLHKQIDANNYAINYCKEHVVHDESIVKNVFNELNLIESQLEKISKDY